MPRWTGVTEGYYRRASAAAATNSTTTTDRHPERATNHDDDAAAADAVPPARDGKADDRHHHPDASPHHHRGIIGSSSKKPGGAWRPPGELGVPMVSENDNDGSAAAAAAASAPLLPSQQQQNNHASSSSSSPMVTHPNIRHWQQQNAQLAALAQSEPFIQCQLQQVQDVARTLPGTAFSCVVAGCWQGLEVLVGSTDWPAVYVLHARTHQVLQHLSLPPPHHHGGGGGGEEAAAAVVVNLYVQSESGAIVVVQANGMIGTYWPYAVDATEVSYGKFRWRNGPIVNMAPLFYQNEPVVLRNCVDAAAGHHGGEGRIDVSQSRDGGPKLLVAHRAQLAVFDVTCRPNDDHDNNTTAVLLWTTQLPHPIVTAKLSGDGNSIAVVLQRPRRSKLADDRPDNDEYEEDDDDDDAAAADGVHTLERDWDDGGGGSNSSLPSPTGSPERGGGAGPTDKTATPASLSSSVGIVYKPGPFLVHAAPVTHLSFRGRGHDYSHVSVSLDGDGGDNVSSNTAASAAEATGNDLLLTYCATDCTARIYGQSNWIPLVDWVTPPQTRIDWVQGVSACTLGDLDGPPPKSSSSSMSSSSSTQSGGGGNSSQHGRPPRSRGPSRSNSFKGEGSIHSDGGGSGSDSFNAALGKRQHFQSVPQHSTTSSNAGAWISELTFSGPYPALRLSRLTYLKRGAEDLNPTLIESVSAFLPFDAVLPQRVLQADECGFVVQGVWATWHPWLLTELTQPEHNDTLRGSAMAFLGLAQTPGGVGGGGAGSNFFGDPSLGGTQAPPCEVRICSSFPLPGHVSVLELPLSADRSLNALEFGHPRRHLLALSDMDCRLEHNANLEQTRKRRPSQIYASIPYMSCRLLARANKMSRHVSLSWRQPGTGSIVPHNWLPQYADPLTTAKLLTDSGSFVDETLLIAPYTLPFVQLPSDFESIRFLLWWPLETDLQAPHLCCIMNDGTMLVFQITPPWIHFEPEMPELDEQTPSAADDFVDDYADEEARRATEYEVLITPDADYGLGLRLESQFDGMPAIAGSYKRHPVTGGTLPAEETGQIGIGDELLSANGVNLEDKLFDDIIATVRDVGSTCGPQNPIRMKFRRARRRHRGESSATDGSGRRTMSQMLGVSPEKFSVAGSPPRQAPYSFDSADGLPNVSPVSSNKIESRPACTLPLVGAFEQVVESSADARTTLLLPVPHERGEAAARAQEEAAILVTGSNGQISVKLLKLAAADDGSTSAIFDLAFANVANGVRSLKVASVLGQDISLVLTDKAGAVWITTISLNVVKSEVLPRAASIETNRAFYSGSSGNVNLIVASASLMITAVDDGSGKLSDIKVWTARPNPGVVLGGAEDEMWDYGLSDLSVDELSADVPSDGPKIHHVCFVDTGHLDVSPPVAIFCDRVVAVFKRTVNDVEYRLHIKVAYPALLPSQQGLSVRSTIRFCSDTPANDIPHVLTQLQSLHASKDEAIYMKSDWHPTSILALLCSDPEGASKTLHQQIRYLLLWLCSEGREIPEDYLRGPLLVSPLPVLEIDSDESEPMGMNSDEREVLKSFQDAVLKHIGCTRATTASSTEFPMHIPPILLSMNKVDFCSLWAICEIVLDPPALEKLDPFAQLFFFCKSLFDVLRSLRSTDVVVSPKYVPPTFLTKRASAPVVRSDAEIPHISYAACCSALVSDSQSMLIERCQRSFQHPDWQYIRQLRMAFWIRSDMVLAQIAEAVGQSVFREKRNILDAALFFVIARKMRKLRNLAATDQNDGGRKFYKFIMDYDFATERGRRSAEKNAFSLLRKNKYRSAATFFLLADPPFLKMAIDTIYTKLQDPDLAFLVARLVESKGIPSEQLRPSFGGQASLSAFGGGGGYASTGPNDSQLSSDGESLLFSAWNPSIGVHGKDLLIDRLLPQTSNHQAGAIYLIWLGKRDEASWWMPGFISQAYGSKSGHRVTQQVDTSGPFVEQSLKSSSQDAFDAVNTIIDFAATPLLLGGMEASDRCLKAGCLVVARALGSRGVEIPALHLIKNVLDKRYERTTNANAMADNALQNAAIARSPAAASSIFDSFDAPSSARRNGAKSMPSPAASAGMPSSIFESYNAPVRPAPLPKVESDGVASSIFDDFDVPVQSKAKSSAPAADPGMNSSIFDDFGPAPPTNGHSNSVRANEMEERETTTSTTTDGGAPTMSDIHAAPDLVEPELDLSIETMPSPALWDHWNRELFVTCAVRRLIREVASVLAQFNGEPSNPAIVDFYKDQVPLVPSEASLTLQLNCDAESIIMRIRQSFDELCTVTSLSRTDLGRLALKILGPTLPHHRTLSAIVLYSAIGRGDVAEDILRKSAADMLLRCHSLALGNSGIPLDGKARLLASSQFQLRRIARISWHLEVALWLHRGGGLNLSGNAVKDAIVAVRVGLMIASWNQSCGNIESLLRCPPDCVTDDAAGRMLWTSLKVLEKADKRDNNSKKTTSGGWEFLVDCRRSEASEMLRDRQTGCFIIRPHTNDHGVFTLSFKTNLKPADESGPEIEPRTPDVSGDELSDSDAPPQSVRKNKRKITKKDDIVQHAVIRLSDSGFRCGSFGPFTSLISLLEAVSASLPFKLRFDLPPTNRVIQEDGSQPSPNAVLLRKIALHRASSLASHPPLLDDNSKQRKGKTHSAAENADEKLHGLAKKQALAMLLELLAMTQIRRQLSGVVAVHYEDRDDCAIDDEMETMATATAMQTEVTAHFATATRTVQPILMWCRLLEIAVMPLLAPYLSGLDSRDPAGEAAPHMAESGEDAIELAPYDGSKDFGGDAILRRMIQRDSGVDFTTLRLMDGGDCTMVVLFGKDEAIQWLLSSGSEHSEASAMQRLQNMEGNRVIERIDLSKLPLKQKNSLVDEGMARYRFVDPWEVEAVASREGETRSAALGRERFLGFSFAKVTLAVEPVLRAMGGPPMVELWTVVKGSVVATKALASVHAPWERDCGGDLELTGGTVTEPSPYFNSIRQHLYRNALFRRLDMPTRFLALVQVELLDLKNLTSPGGALALSVYALLRLKRPSSSATLTNKSRTLDCAATHPIRLGKTSGPTAPASWGSVVRFRFPLPEDSSVEKPNFDGNREILFKGPPSVLQLTVYEKKLLTDHCLGTADVRMEALSAGGQLEEWVPLRSEKHGIAWFARIRLTLRFELMCLAMSWDDNDVNSSSELRAAAVAAAPSVGLQRIEELSRSGGSTHEEVGKHGKGGSSGSGNTSNPHRTMSSPDLMSYFESMVY